MAVDCSHLRPPLLQLHHHSCCLPNPQRRHYHCLSHFWWRYCHCLSHALRKQYLSWYMPIMDIIAHTLVSNLVYPSQHYSPLVTNCPFIPSPCNMLSIALCLLIHKTPGIILPFQLTKKEDCTLLLELKIRRRWLYFLRRTRISRWGRFVEMKNWKINTTTLSVKLYSSNLFYRCCWKSATKWIYEEDESRSGQSNKEGGSLTIISTHCIS